MAEHKPRRAILLGLATGLLLLVLFWEPWAQQEAESWGLLARSLSLRPRAGRAKVTLPAPPRPPGNGTASICVSGLDARAEVEEAHIKVNSWGLVQDVVFTSDSCQDVAVLAGVTLVRPQPGLALEPALGHTLDLEDGGHGSASFEVPPGCVLRGHVDPKGDECPLRFSELRYLRGTAWVDAGLHDLGAEFAVVVGCGSQIKVSSADPGEQVWPQVEAIVTAPDGLTIQPRCIPVKDLVLLVRSADGDPIPGARVVSYDGSETRTIRVDGLRLPDHSLVGTLGTLRATGFLDRNAWLFQADRIEFDEDGTARVEFRLTASEGKRVRVPDVMGGALSSPICVGDFEGWLPCETQGEEWSCACGPSTPVFALPTGIDHPGVTATPLQLPYLGEEPLRWVEVCDDPTTFPRTGTWDIWAGPPAVGVRYRDALGASTRRQETGEATPLCVLAPEHTLLAFRADSAFTVEGELLAIEGAVFRWPTAQ